MPTMTPPRTTVALTARPWARIDADSNDERFDTLLDALIADPRAVAGDAITTVDGEVSTVFQVEVNEWEDRPIERASAIAVAVFDSALAKAGFDVRTAGISVVEGDDADLLP